MKKILSAFFFLFCQFANGQGSNFWVLLGAERVGGSYTGVGNYVPNDKYTLQNAMNYRFEINGKGWNSFIDFSWPTLWLFNMQKKDQLSTRTERGMHYVEDNTIFRWCNYYLSGEQKTRGLRLGWGWQFDWRRFGVAETYDGGSVLKAEKVGFGPLERKGRFGVGLNGHLMGNLGKACYTRLTLNVDYSPGKIQGVSAYPEWMLIFHIGDIGLYTLATYRIDYLWGNRMENHTPLKKDNAIRNCMRLEVGAAFNLRRFL